jgi:hypothetical protein
MKPLTISRLVLSDIILISQKRIATVLPKTTREKVSHKRDGRYSQDSSPTGMVTHACLTAPTKLESDVHVTVHSDKFLLIKPTRYTNFSNFIFGMKLHIFQTVSLSIIRSFSLHTQQWYMSYGFADSLRAGSGWNSSSILILLASCQHTCMTYTIAVCTVVNS